VLYLLEAFDVRYGDHWALNHATLGCLADAFIGDNLRTYDRHQMDNNNNTNNTTPVESDDWTPHLQQMAYHRLVHYSPPPFTLTSEFPPPFDDPPCIDDADGDPARLGELDALFAQFPFPPSQTAEREYDPSSLGLLRPAFPEWTHDV